MTAAFFTGLALGLALIVPIGAQNVFVFGQGVSLGMPRALWAVVGAAVCDTILIVLGAAGTSALLNTVPGLRPAMLVAGALFLTYLGVKSLRAKPTDLDDETGVWSRGQVLRRTMAVSLLNPHAILDTVGVLGAAITAQAVATRLPFAVGAVISPASRPILSSRHSKASALPVAIAIFGMSPSVAFLGRRVRTGSLMGVVVQSAIAGIVTCRRQRPSWITSGMSLPVGASWIMKLPSEPVTPKATGSPGSLPSQRSQVTPVASGATGPFGM